MSILTYAYFCLSLGVQHKNRAKSLLNDAKIAPVGFFFVLFWELRGCFLQFPLFHAKLRMILLMAKIRRSPVEVGSLFPLFCRVLPFLPLIMEVENHPK